MLESQIEGECPAQSNITADRVARINLLANKMQFTCDTRFTTSSIDFRYIDILSKIF